MEAESKEAVEVERRLWIMAKKTVEQTIEVARTWKKEQKVGCDKEEVRNGNLNGHKEKHPATKGYSSGSTQPNDTSESD